MATQMDKFADFLQKNHGIDSLSKGDLDQHLGESDITTGDTEDEKDDADERRTATKLVESLKKVTPEEEEGL